MRSKLLTAKDIDKAYNALKKCKMPVQCCPMCNQPVFVHPGGTMELFCIDCLSDKIRDAIISALQELGK